jgi:hypothetical protein
MKAYQVTYKHTEEHRDAPEDDLGFYLSLDKARQIAEEKVVELNARDPYGSSPLTTQNNMEWHDGYFTFVTILPHDVKE